MAFLLRKLGPRMLFLHHTQTLVLGIPPVSVLFVTLLVRSFRVYYRIHRIFQALDGMSRTVYRVLCVCVCVRRLFLTIIFFYFVLFSSDWGFVMAFHPTKKEKCIEVVKKWRSISPCIIDDLIEKHISNGETALKMYDGITHVRMFSLTKGKITIHSSYVRVRYRLEPCY